MVLYTIEKLEELIRRDEIVTELDGRDNIHICIVASSADRMRYLADEMFDLLSRNGYNGHKAVSTVCSVTMHRGIGTLARYNIYIKIATESREWFKEAGNRCHVFAVEQDAFEESFCDATKLYVSDKDTAYIPIDIEFFMEYIYRQDAVDRLHDSDELNKFLDGLSFNGGDVHPSRKEKVWF